MNDTERDRPAPGDAPALPEITPEMKRVGVEAYFAFRPESYEFEEIVAAIYRRMHSLNQKAGS